MKRKKEGASLIVVIIVFMFVSTVSMATISMVSGNYKARIVENKRVENLYGSDSGLDVAYNIIGKTFDAATKYGYWEVEELKKEDPSRNSKSPNNSDYIELRKDIRQQEDNIKHWKHYNDDKDSDNKMSQSEINKKIKECNEKIKSDNAAIEVLINNEFKRTFKNFMYSVKNEENPDTPSNELKDSIESKKYVDKVNSINDFTSVDVKFANQDPPTLHVQGIELNDDEYTVIVQSDFETNAENTKVIGKNQRKVQATYTIKVPNYNDIFFGQGVGDLPEYLVLEDRGLTIGGDMEVDNASLEVNGDIFVQGKDLSVTKENRTYGKYRGGIKLNNSRKVIFNNDVITRGTLNIESNVGRSKEEPAKIEGNLYAANIYAGNAKQKNSIISNSYLKVDNDAVIDNDLSIKASDTQIEIANYYGINDKNIDIEGDEISSDLQNKSRTSSSIIVNDYTNTDKTASSVTITDNAYIMGTAHIATEENYQTGESVAVKGNYIAYSIPLSEAEKFRYDNPLQVLDEDNVFTKANHFFNYWDSENGEAKKYNKTANNGGISLPINTYAIGAIVYKDGDTTTVKTPRYVLDSTENDVIASKRKEYAKRVYNLGTELGNEQTLYNSLGDGAIEVESIMKFDDMPDEYDLDSEITKNGDKAIFNGSKECTIILQDKDISKNKVYSDSENKEITNKKIIKADSDNNINAVIATAGNVIIDGNVTFNGTIIANQDLTITGDGVKIKYDPEVIERLQIKNTKNAELFKSVFDNSIIKQYEVQNSSDDNPKTADEKAEYDKKMLATKYDLKNFLDTKLWKIIK